MRTTILTSTAMLALLAGCASPSQPDNQRIATPPSGQQPYAAPSSPLTLAQDMANRVMLHEGCMAAFNIPAAQAGMAPLRAQLEIAPNPSGARISAQWGDIGRAGREDVCGSFNAVLAGPAARRDASVFSEAFTQMSQNIRRSIMSNVTPDGQVNKPAIAAVRENEAGKFARVISGMHVQQVQWALPRREMMPKLQGAR